MTTTTTTTTTITTNTNTNTNTTTTTTTTKEIYFCLSLITYHIFKSITKCVKKHGYHQQHKCCPGVIPNQ